MVQGPQLAGTFGPQGPQDGRMQGPPGQWDPTGPQGPQGLLPQPPPQGPQDPQLRPKLGPLTRGLEPQAGTSPEYGQQPLRNGRNIIGPCGYSPT